VVNAVCDALGVKHFEMPATPDRVWAALQTKGA
jgi:carbon-monoxide dehydrogenase large subunit